VSAEPPLSGTAEVGGGGHSVTVLVADDNEVSQRLCRRVLEKAGYKVLTASDGLEAVSLALANSPDLILLDDAMPGMDSLWAARQIKKQRPGTAIVIASVHLNAGDRERYMAAGADDMLIKPFRLSDLIAVAAKLTASRGRQMKDLTGTRLGSDEIVERLGGGGMADVRTQPSPSADPGAKDALPPFRMLAGPARLFASVVIVFGLASLPLGWFTNPIPSDRFPTLLYLAIGTQIAALMPITWRSGRHLVVDPLLIATGLLFPGAGVGLVALLATFDGRVPPRSIPWWAFFYNHAMLAAVYAFPSIVVAHIGPSVIRFDSWDDYWVIPVRTAAYAVTALGLNYLSTALALALVQRKSFWVTLFDNVGLHLVFATLTLSFAGGVLYLLLQFPVGYVIAPVLFGFVLAIRGNIADARMQTVLKERTLDLAIQSLDARDRYMASHSIRVSELAGLLGEHLGLGGREVELLRTAGSLHDLGMIGVRDDVLNKPASLNDKEWELMRRHPDIGADMIAQHPALAEVAPLVRHHHERWDGTGYPAGLKGDVIPFGARILAAADSFDAITSERIYRRSVMTPIEAVEDISRQANHWYDPDVVNALREIHGLSPL
jgi:response regulator RpfG family c-di-GMP phosphodiesterase